MDWKHIGKAHKVILSAFGTIALFVENKSQVDRLIGPAFLWVSTHFFISVYRQSTIFMKLSMIFRYYGRFCIGTHRTKSLMPALKMECIYSICIWNIYTPFHSEWTVYIPFRLKKTYLLIIKPCQMCDLCNNLKEKSITERTLPIKLLSSFNSI